MAEQNARDMTVNGQIDRTTLYDILHPRVIILKGIHSIHPRF